MRDFDQPPGVHSYHAAVALPGFRTHAASPREAVRLEGEDIVVATPRRAFRFNHVICATGYVLDLAAHAELRQLADKAVTWRDRYCPAQGEENPELGTYPYVADGYDFIPRDPAEAWIGRVHAFNPASFVSAGPHSTSITGHKHALPRLLTRRLLLEQEDAVLDALRAYDEHDFIVPPHPIAAAEEAVDA